MSLTMNAVKHLFLYLLTSCISSFVKWSSLLPILKIGLLSLISVDWQECFLYSGSESLPDVRTADIFSSL